MHRIRAINNYVLDLESETLWHGNQEIRLRPKLFAMLVYLANNPNRLLATEELLKKIWPDVYVCPEIVKSSIRDLRKLLNDDPKKPCFIETKHSRGYRFIGNITIKSAAQENQFHAPDGAKYSF